MELASYELSPWIVYQLTTDPWSFSTYGLCDSFLIYCVGAVVGALADWVNNISRLVCVPDCGDLPVLQSSDLSLSAHG